ncbi:MAG: hypothetical protein HOP33_16555 [Verrucomicrobia bacterium]|nr:hypothetical protein [Verrucomicrobiota bacterium]
MFCQPQLCAKTKSALRDALAADNKLAYLKAAMIASPVDPNCIALDKLWEDNFFNLPGHRSPTEQHSLTIDNPAEPLEPIYFELLHGLSAHEEWTIEKLIDTASATPASGLSLDLNRRSQMDQHEATKLLTFMRQRIRSFVQEWQKWREQKRQLTLYAQARTPEDPAHESARHRLSHKWQEGEHIVGADREAAFVQWLNESESELRTQAAIGRDLLAGDLNLLRLQANWLRPYLHAQSKSRHANDPAMVTAFNTAIFDIVLLVKMNSPLQPMVESGELPKMLLNPKHRGAEPVLIVEIKFRAIPERVKSGAYAYRGRAELQFTSYALTDAELTILRRELNRSEWGEMLGMLETNLSGNLNALLNDLDELLVEPKAEKATKQPDKTNDPNPFTALIDFTGWFSQNETPEQVTLLEPLKPDTEPEAVIRSLNLLEARQRCLELYHRSKELFTSVHHPV